MPSRTSHRQFLLRFRGYLSSDCGPARGERVKEVAYRRRANRKGGGRSPVVAFRINPVHYVVVKLDDKPIVCFVIERHLLLSVFSDDQS